MGGGSKNRIQFVDSLKGFAIFLVVWGHSIQHIWNDYSFYDDKVFEFIYSFHMSLFFLLSGFFSLSSLKLDVKDFFLKKGSQLLLPCLVWGGILTGLKFISYMRHDEWMPDVIAYFYQSSLYNPGLWFLPTLFVVFTIVFLANKLTRNLMLASALAFAVTLLLPDNDYIRGYMVRAFLPMFIAGLIFKYLYNQIQGKVLFYTLLFGILFIVLLFFWQPNYTVYLSQPSAVFHFDSKMYQIWVFRTIVGLSGSLFFFFLFQYVYVKNKAFEIVSYVGKYTLEIYILQAVFLKKLVENITVFQQVNLFIYDFILTPFVSILFLLISLFIIRVISKSKILNMFLLGKTMF